MNLQLQILEIECQIAFRNLLMKWKFAGTSGKEDSEQEPVIRSGERWSMPSWLLGGRHPGVSKVLLGAAAGVSLLGVPHALS